MLDLSALVLLTIPWVTTSTFNNIPEFPPRIRISQNKNLPTGHLRPLGYQRPPDGPVKEYSKVLTPEVFWEKHVSCSLPLVFREGIGESPALSTWTDEHLRENYGDLDVLIELKEENRSHSTGRMNIAVFLDRYKQEDIYAVTLLPDPMRREIQVKVPEVTKNSSSHNNVLIVNNDEYYFVKGPKAQFRIVNLQHR